MANLDPVFCKMSVSIWIRGKTFFSQSFFTFLATKFSRFGGHGQFSGNPVPQVGFAGNPVLLRNGPNF